MKTVLGINHGRIRRFATFGILIFLSSFNPDVRGQNVDSLIELVAHSVLTDSVISAKLALPLSYHKTDFRTLDAVRRLKAIGVTESNASLMNIHNLFSTPIFQIDNSARIRAMVNLEQIDTSTIGQIRRLGVTVEYVDAPLKRLVCLIPFDKVEQTAGISNVTSIWSIPPPVTNVGAYTTAGDSILEANTARTDFSVDGKNVKVGVISDGVNHYENSISTGDLPASFQVINNRNGGDEGTAMSEIVYDIAPGVSLAFSDDGTSDESFDASIDALKAAGCNVIVDDVIYFDEPMFEDGVIAQTVDSVTAAGLIYVSSAGNEGMGTWDGMGTSANNDGWVTFSGSNETNSMVVPAGGSVTGLLQWADKWGLSSDDYDLYLLNGPSLSSSVLASSTYYQEGAGYDPLEYLTWQNNSSRPVTVYFRINMYSVSTPREMKLLVINATNPLQYVTDYGVIGHAAASSCISAGAISAFSPDTIEDYSSHGPSRIYVYNSSGEIISYVNRPTPTVCGIDGVQTYVGTSGIWPPGDPYFYGTSAAAPHIAGIAALLLSENPLLSWQPVEQLFTNSATKISGMGGQNFTNAYGYGRANAYQALQDLVDQSLYVEVAGIECIVGVGKIQIEWETKSEVDNLGFIISRKQLPDGNTKVIANYESDDSLRGLGTSTTGKNYSYTDFKVEAGQSYQYTIEGVSTEGAVISFPPVQATAGVPQTVSLYQNYPNPFNPSTGIQYQLPQNAHVILKVYDPLGRVVSTLVNGEETAGYHEVTFDGSSLPSGVYFYRLETPGVEIVKKMLLVK